MRISDWSSDVCSSDLMHELGRVLDYFDQTRPAGVIIQSGKEAGFIAGADIDEFAGLDTSAKGMELVSRGWTLFNRLARSEEHTSELQSLMRNSYAVFCLTKKITTQLINNTNDAIGR